MVISWGQINYGVNIDNLWKQKIKTDNRLQNNTSEYV